MRHDKEVSFANLEKGDRLFLTGGKVCWRKKHKPPFRLFDSVFEESHGSLIVLQHMSSSVSTVQKTIPTK
jgi:hypothetical protein